MKTTGITLCLCLWAGAALGAEKPVTCTYEPTVTTLTGVVKNDRLFYGPPGFGENPKVDAKETPERLVLDAPIDVKPTKDDHDNEAVASVKELQIVPNVVPDLKPYLDRRVTVTGKLFQGHTGHHHTPALIALDSIELVKAPSQSTR